MDYPRRVHLSLSLPFGHAYTHDDFSGAALWIPPNAWRRRFHQQLLDLPVWARSIGWRRLPRIISDTKALVLLSGGMDSAVVAALAKARGRQLSALSIDYGQSHRREFARLALQQFHQPCTGAPSRFAP